jgi:hypothetical protein
MKQPCACASLQPHILNTRNNSRESATGNGQSNGNAAGSVCFSYRKNGDTALSHGRRNVGGKFPPYIVGEAEMLYPFPASPQCNACGNQAEPSDNDFCRIERRHSCHLSLSLVDCLSSPSSGGGSTIARRVTSVRIATVHVEKPTDRAPGNPVSMYEPGVY